MIVIGTSAGGVEALRSLCRGLPADLPAAVFMVLHIAPEGGSILPELLSRAGPLPAVHPPADGEGVRFERGRIYVAPPDRHMVIEGDRVRAVMSAKENRHRPAADPLFRSAARHHGPHVVGVVLTGALDDGAAGLAAIKRQGGLAVVQDPEDALFPSMPRTAMQHVAVDHSVSLAEMPALLARLASDDLEHAPLGVPEALEVETRITTMNRPEPEDVARIGRPSMFTCPECHGTLFEIDDDKLLRFRCHVGHAYTAEALAADQSEALEATLWAAVRAFEERAELADRMAARGRHDGRPDRAQIFSDRAALARRRAGQVRAALTPARENEPEPGSRVLAGRGQAGEAGGDR